MTIRTLDMQVLIPKVNEVSRVQQVQQQQNTNRQQEFIAQQAQLLVKNETSVTQSSRSQPSLIQDEKEKEKERTKKNPKQKEGKKEAIKNTEELGTDKLSLGKNIDLMA